MNKTPQKRWAWLACALLSVLALPLAASEVPCSACHAQAANSLATMPHGKLPENKAPECSDCHGEGQNHLQAPGEDTIFGFKNETVKRQNAVCGSCHEQAHEAPGNAHSRADISCSACHGIHEKKKALNLPAKFKSLGVGSRSCYGCHEDTFAQFGHNERHRLRAGALECSSCHDPHRPQAGLRLGGFKQSACSRCHADVQGPFIFEHAASRVEGCTACHAPHGSANRHLLVHQNVGSLCYSCHAEVPQFHLGFSPSAPARFDERSVCTNCHIAIHGSNVDRSLLR